MKSIWIWVVLFVFCACSSKSSTKEEEIADDCTTHYKSLKPDTPDAEIPVICGCYGTVAAKYNGKSDFAGYAACKNSSATALGLSDEPPVFAATETSTSSCVAIKLPNQNDLKPAGTDLLQCLLKAFPNKTNSASTVTNTSTGAAVVAGGNSNATGVTNPPSGSTSNTQIATVPVPLNSWTKSEVASAWADCVVGQRDRGNKTKAEPACSCAVTKIMEKYKSYSAAVAGGAAMKTFVQTATTSCGGIPKP